MDSANKTECVRVIVCTSLSWCSASCFIALLQTSLAANLWELQQLFAGSLLFLLSRQHKSTEGAVFDKTVQ